MITNLLPLVSLSELDKRLKKYAQLCIHNDHFDKATKAYESNYKLAHNSIHHCADKAIMYVKALVEYAPSLSLSEARKVNTKALSFLKTMTLDLSKNELERLKKMQKKYQRVAGI